MQIDRELFFQVLGGQDAVARMSDEEKAEALERYLIDQLNNPDYPKAAAASRRDGAAATIRRGSGVVFGDGHSEPYELAPLPDRPTLVDFLLLRANFHMVRHLLQSAAEAQKSGASEEQILACLLHDFGQSLMRVDHGWWGAQLVEPYVPERVAWAIRYHQPLRFFPDESVGYHYPELYVQIYGKDYVPEPYIQDAYRYARNHPWYMDARMVTVCDLYAFDPDAKVTFEPFLDILGRHFRQPKEGLGFDGSPVAHMWRSLLYPNHPL
jgi:hypothetical protein